MENKLFKLTIIVFLTFYSVIRISKFNANIFNKDEISYNDEKVFSFNKTSTEMMNSKRRSLITKDEYIEMCVTNKVNITNNFLTNISSTFQDYIANYSEYDVQYKEDLKKALEGDKTARVSLLKTLFMPYVVLAVLAGLTVLGWMLYITCCFFPFLCCKFDVKEEPKMGCRNFSFLIFALSTAGTIAVCIIGFAVSQDFIPKADLVECSLLNFFVEAKYGEVRNEGPNWIGYNNSEAIFTNLNSEFKQINKDYQRTLRNQDWVKDEQSKFQTRLTDIFLRYKDTKVTNPNPLSSISKISPDFTSVS